MLSDVHVSINYGILMVVEEIQEYLKTELQIQATQQDIIENAIVALQIELKKANEQPHNDKN
ncbi:hypothetical protein B5G90_17420 [Listeria monocytogenes]|nr:hypothetical protein [Listeria monocytogenes]EAC5490931.1 hypothetical protein [Listeria monocytogenes]EAC9707149.1 hypothetical protein [Listeria monocytogenes]MIM11750.1 hypothetical protein [Listeria monocytogenes]